MLLREATKGVLIKSRSRLEMRECCVLGVHRHDKVPANSTFLSREGLGRKKTHAHCAPTEGQ